MLHSGVALKLFCLLFVLIKYLVNLSCLLNQEIEPNHMFAGDLRLRLLSKINFFVCLWKHKVRRFSEAYFFTEHHKEISLTFQEEL